MISSFLIKLTEKILSKEDIAVSEANKLVDVPIYDLLYCANEIRQNFFGKKIKFCSIINTRSGKCSEDCKFCAQSSQYNADISSFPLIDEDKIRKAEEETCRNNAYSLGLVTSGKSPSDEDIEKLLEYIKKTKLVEPHASLGVLTEEKASLLKKAGLKMYNHNLETSQDFFPKICSTHSYDDRINTVKIAKKHFKVCSGGIFGLGEEWKDRIELAFTLKELNVDCVPLNFLNPVEGTPLENAQPLKPFEILRIIAMYRFILPDKTIEIAGGREKNLRDLQSWIFYAGANAALTGNYLTTAGKDPKEDNQMIKDLELSVK